MHEPIIELHDLTKQYGKFSAVDRINLTVRKGEIFGIAVNTAFGKLSVTVGFKVDMNLLH